MAALIHAPVNAEAGRRGSTPGQKRAYRATILHFTDDPGDDGRVGDHSTTSNCVQYFPDGLLVIAADGTVDHVGPFEASWGGVLHDARRHDYRDHLIVPGFVETHIHSGQVDIVAAFSKQLISWLHESVFPSESQFADEVYAREANRFFLNTLLAAGTTTASIFTTRHKHSADTLFDEATELNMRILAGRVLMDHPSIPEYLRDGDFREARRETEDLIHKWHFVGRNIYSVPLRFALSSSDHQLRDTEELMDSPWPRGNSWLHTHMAESREETQMVKARFNVSGYLAAYEKFGLVRHRTIFGHCIWTTEAEMTRMAENGAAAAFCPTSNLFLGSGLFRLHKFLEHKTRVGIGTDMGAGNGYSMLRVMEEAYKVVGVSNAPRCEPEAPIVCDTDRVRLSPLRAFYLATLGGARALHLDYKQIAGDGGYVGNFQPGKEADFVVLDWNATPTLRRRMEAAERLHVEDKSDNTEDQQIFLGRLFALMMLGDERCTRATYVMGVKRYERDEAGSEFRPWHDAGYNLPSVWAHERPLSSNHSSPAASPSA